MPSLSPRDRLSLCHFTFADGRTCRTPRLSSHPNFCFYHAQLETQSQAAAALAADIARLFSGNYLSANDLSAALARLIPAVLQGHVKARTARTVAYMIQTLLQTIRLAQNEYVQAFGADPWRHAVSASIHAHSNGSVPSDVRPVPNPGATRIHSASPRPSDPAKTPLAPAPANACPPESSEGSPRDGNSPGFKGKGVARTSPAQSPVNAATQPPTPSLPVHRQPETIAAALAAARSLFPHPRARQAPTDETSTNQA